MTHPLEDIVKGYNQPFQIVQPQDASSLNL